MSTQENTSPSDDIESLEYPSMCGQRRMQRPALSESDEGDLLEGGHEYDDHLGGLQSH